MSESKWMSFIHAVFTRRAETKPILCLSSELPQCVVHASKQHFITIKSSNMWVMLVNTSKFTDIFKHQISLMQTFKSTRPSLGCKVRLVCFSDLEEVTLLCLISVPPVEIIVSIQRQWSVPSLSRMLLLKETKKIPQWTNETIMKEEIQEMNYRDVPDKLALMCLWRARVNKMMAKLIW